MHRACDRGAGAEAMGSEPTEVRLARIAGPARRTLFLETPEAAPRSKKHRSETNMKNPNAIPQMHTKTVGYLIFYGGFLILMGLAGYLSNPEHAKTALISGSASGALAILWAILGARGLNWSLHAALTTTVLLAGVFAWRAGVGWLAVFDGHGAKWFGASLVTLMLGASIAMLVRLIQALKASRAETAARV
jgi:uncharacterized membrane protein (UPF0136 family)